MHWRRVQKNSIKLAIFVGFLVILLFHETKIPTVDMKVRVSSNFSQIFWKKMKSIAPWGMEDLTLPSVGASFKKWGCYTHTNRPQEAQALATCKGL
jgi:hypothetical protein